MAGSRRHRQGSHRLNRLDAGLGHLLGSPRNWPRIGSAAPQIAFSSDRAGTLQGDPRDPLPSGQADHVLWFSKKFAGF